MCSISTVLDVFLLTVKIKFAVDGDATLVLERDGAVVEPEFDMISALSTAKETLMILAPGEIWQSAASMSANEVKLSNIFKNHVECLHTQAFYRQEFPSFWMG